MIIPKQYQNLFIISALFYIMLVIFTLAYLLYLKKRNKNTNVNLPTPKRDIDYFTDDALYSSTIGFMLEKNNNKRIINITDNKQYFVIQSTFPIKIEDLKNKTIKIYYKDDVSLFMMKVILYCFNIKQNDFEKDTEGTSTGTSTGNPSLYCKFITEEEENVNYLNYDTINKDKLFFFLPYIRFEVIPQTNINAIVVDMLNYTTIPTTIPTKLTKPTKRAYTTNTLHANNFYMLFFPFVEGFFQDEIVLTIDKPIEINTILNKYDDLKIINIRNQTLILKPGDTCVLSNQKNKSYNGVYYVSNLNNGKYLTLQTYKYLLYFDDLFDINKKTDTTIIGVLKNTKVLGKYDGKVWYIDLDMSGTILKDRTLIFAPRNIDDYVCVEDNTYKTQKDCESEINPLGLIKNKMTWDRHCRNNTDCPFFNNVRGGCDNGYCEMPVGVERIGYTRYLLGDSSFPYCHNCPDILNPNCCDTQTNPDYAFPKDYLQRNNYNAY